MAGASQHQRGYACDGVNTRPVSVCFGWDSSLTDPPLIRYGVITRQAFQRPEVPADCGRLKCRGLRMTPILKGASPRYHDRHPGDKLRTSHTSPRSRADLVLWPSSSNFDPPDHDSSAGAFSDICFSKACGIANCETIGSAATPTLNVEVNAALSNPKMVARLTDLG